MAQCAYCEAETWMYDRGTPICISCSNAREAKTKRPSTDEIRRMLHEDLVKTSERSQEISEAFNLIMSDTPSGMPHPDGKQRIHNASRALSIAREETMKAHNRLNDFLRRDHTGRPEAQTLGKPSGRFFARFFFCAR